MIRAPKAVLLGVAMAALSMAGESPTAGHGTQPGGAQQPPQVVGPLFTLALSAVRDSVTSGSPVNARVVTTNTSSGDIYFMWPRGADLALAYQVDVHDINGNVPPDTELRRRNGPSEGSMAVLRLKRGAASTDVIDMGTWYDFTQPGSYTIRVRRFAMFDRAVAESNAITVTVVPPVTLQSAPSGAHPPFSLTLWISPRAKSFPLGNVWFDVITQNTSDHKILLRTQRVDKEQAGVVYKVDVESGNGGVPPLTESGRASDIRGDAPPPPASATPREAGESLRLLPGEKWRDSIRVDNLYQIREPGQYTIQVRRWDDETKTWVKSNPLVVTVTP